MFRSPDNVFSNVKCPELANSGSCMVVSCLFDHGTQKRETDADKNDHGGQKRLKPNNEDPAAFVETPKEVEEKDVLFIVVKALSTGLLLPKLERLDNTKRISEFMSTKTRSHNPNKDAINREYEIASSSKTLNEYRKSIASLLCIEGEGVPAADLQRIQPIEVHPSPAVLPVRRRYIELFADAIKQHSPHNEAPIWTATDEEYKIASTSSSTTYNVAMKKRMYEMSHPKKSTHFQKRTFMKEQYLEELRSICIDKEKLVKFGYVMDIPETIDQPAPVRYCHRCKTEFKLEHAGKEADCRYHSGKIVKSEIKERVYLCCGGVVGATDTEPCALFNYHVFYWSDAAEMHHLLPYLDTRLIWGVRNGSLEAVGIDCEMGFTTKGFELLRITALDFFSGEEVIDLLVRPKGKVLDLNTRWSGIASVKEESMIFEDAITLLGEVIDSNAVLIGHGLENDLNAMRLIHHRIVDTAVLFPKHKATPTYRFSLKQLAFQCLGRNIQVGEHDSGEDSLAAIDITKHFIERDLERQLRRVSA